MCRGVQPSLLVRFREAPQDTSVWTILSLSLVHANIRGVLHYRIKATQFNDHYTNSLLNLAGQIYAWSQTPVENFPLTSQIVIEGEEETSSPPTV